MQKIRKLAAVLFLCFGFVFIFQLNSASAAVKFNVTNQTLKKDIAKYSVGVTVNGSEQRFTIKASEITKLTVKSKKQAGTKMTVKSTVYIDREIALVKGNVTSVYKYRNKKWKLSSVTYTSTAISSIRLEGTWSGTYQQSDGLTKVEIKIGEFTPDGFIADSVFIFSASPTNPSIPSGSYTLKGGADKKTGKVTFEGDIWIEQPRGYSFANLYGYVDLKNKKIVAGSYNFSLSKVS